MKSSLLYNLIGIIPFVGLLLIVWICAYASYQKFYHPGISLKAYLFSHIKINAVVVLPWLIISLILEIAAVIAGDFTRVMGNYPLASFAIFAALLGLMAIFFPVLLIKLWDCKPIPAGYLRTRLEDFCRSHHFTCRDILLWNPFDGKLITAEVVGFVTRCRYILISPVLLQILDEKEVESVVAHEIGHVKNRHMINSSHASHNAPVASMFQSLESMATVSPLSPSSICPSASKVPSTSSSRLVINPVLSTWRRYASVAYSQ